jgi:hypothetical protein
MSVFCPEAKFITKVENVDIQAVKIMNNIYQQLQQRMIQKNQTKIQKLTEYILFTGTCECGKIDACNLNICDLISIINQIGPQWIPSQFYYFTLKPFAFAVTENCQFIPIADPIFGGLVANPELYNFEEFPQIYEQAVKNPYGIYVNFEKFLEGDKNCKYPARGYVRILPKCFKKYNRIVIVVSYLIQTIEPVESN